MQYTVFFHELFSASVLPSSISGWLCFFHSIEVLTYEQNLLLFFLDCHTITITINYVDSCPICSFLGTKDSCCNVQVFSLQTSM